MDLKRWVSSLLGRQSEPPPLPKAEARDYAVSELSEYDGSDPQKPLLIAIRGEVYDVTRGRHFYGPGGFYEVFSGRDCTRALARMSFEEEDFTDDIEGLRQDELDQLEEWIEMFAAKYEHVGHLIR